MKSKKLKFKIILSEGQVKNLIDNLISESIINESNNLNKNKVSLQKLLK
jgi:hypothetical protein